MLETGFLSGNVSRAELEQAVTSDNILNGTNSTKVLTADRFNSLGHWGQADNAEAVVTPITIENPPLPDIRYGFRIVNSQSATGGIGQSEIPVIEGKTYTLSCYAKGIGTMILMYGVPGSYPRKTYSVTESVAWRKFSFSFTLTSKDIASNGITNIYIETANCPNGIEICGMKMELGTTSDPVYTMSPYDKLFQALNPIAEMHRNVFRGKYLGDIFTDAQKEAIKNGSFDDIWVGDYWTINGHTWRVADINYWLKKGDTSCETNHILVVPDDELYTHRMNETTTTNGGYMTSEMRTSGLDQAKTMVNTDFGSAYVLNHRNFFINTVANGIPTVGAWENSTVDLMNEIMVYGNHFFAPANNGVTTPIRDTIDNVQLALFRLQPKFVNIERYLYWLRDVVSASHFARVDNYGRSDYSGATYAYGVRPVVGITGGTTTADEPDDDLEVTGLSSKGGEPL